MTGMFDADFFFSRAFVETVREFSRDHEDMNLRLEVVTTGGERLDTLRIAAVEKGARLTTRDDRLVFLPYPHIAHIEVSILQDHRVPSFQLSTSPG
jgi:hypothetical protein